MTEAEFNTYFSEIAAKVKAVIPDDLLFILGLYPKYGVNGSLTGNMKLQNVLIALENHKKALIKELLIEQT